MLRKYGFTLMLCLVLIVPALLLGATSSRADDDRGENRRQVQLLDTVPIPGNPLYGFDISWFDVPRQTYYLADRSNAAIDVLKEKTEKVTQIHAPAAIGGFAGVVFKADGSANNDKSGPNGVVVAGNWLFVTDAPSRVMTFDLRTNQLVAAGSSAAGCTVHCSVLATGSPDGNRADELAYDPVHARLLVVNNADDPPFASLIQVNGDGTLTLLHTITLNNATNGAEQPAFTAGKFYLSLPEVSCPGAPNPPCGGGFPGGGVARINPDSGAVETIFPVNDCQPAGLAHGPDSKLIIGCSVVFDIAHKAWSPTTHTQAAPKQVVLDIDTGATVDIFGVGGSDEVWFNETDKRYYTASRNNPVGPVLGVIDAESNQVVQLVQTINVPDVRTPVALRHPAATAHSVAVNARNSHVFVPLGANNVFPDCLNGCIAIFGRGDEN